MKNQSSLNDLLKFVQLQSKRAYFLEETELSKSIEKTGDPIKRQFEAKKILDNLGQYGLPMEPDELNHAVRITDVVNEVLENEAATVSDLVNKFSDLEQFIFNESFKEDLHKISDLVMIGRLTQKKWGSTYDYQKTYLTYKLLELAILDSNYLSVGILGFLGIPLYLPWEQRTPNLRNHIRSVGVADLLVIKQQILRYEATEVAHIENIMTGENRVREHRYLDRFEETLTFENESIKEEESELETTERFELNRELSKTVKEDQKFGADLSISGKYGPTIVQSSFSAEASFSEESGAKSASEYAKDVVERSLERVQERMRQERVTKILKETEVKNTHSFENILNDSNPNISAEHISGIYQFVDKIYEAQVFNYGKREMFDLIIPEPSSYLWHLQEKDSNSKVGLIEEIEKFDTNPFDIGYAETHVEIAGRGRLEVTNHYTNLAKRYRATGISTPPEGKNIVSFSHQVPSKESGANEPRGEGGKFMVPLATIEVDIKEGYVPKQMKISALGLTDRVNQVRFDISVGSTRTRMSANQRNIEGKLIDLTERGSTDKNAFGGRLAEFTFEEEITFAEESKLFVSIFALESANHTITGEIICEPSKDLMQSWQLETWELINSAYQDRLLEYQNDLARLNAERKAQQLNESKSFGFPPSKQKQIILSELKKHVISLFNSNELYESVDFGGEHPMEDVGDRPRFNVESSIEMGNYIRFFEQAFEWDQMVYSFYPYFWSRRENWENRFKNDDSNYEFQQFMQAGSARVVLPVRRGFEQAVAHYISKNEVWNGLGEPPKIDDPLYLSIIDEIKGPDNSEDSIYPKPVGEPWEIRLPTDLILLRKSETLPKWSRTIEGEWEWSPVEED